MLCIAAEGDKVMKRDTKEYKNADKSANKFAKKVDGTVKGYGKGTKIVQWICIISLEIGVKALAQKKRCLLKYL